MKSYGVTIQMKPPCWYFCMVQLVFHYFTKMNFEIFLEFIFLAPLGVKGNDSRASSVLKRDPPCRGIKGVMQNNSHLH